jgi:hypothetical protein
VTEYPQAFSRAVNRLLAEEGGYVDNPDDPGGETKFGISRRNYPELDLKNLTREEAVRIYYADWWLCYGFDRLPDMISEKTFDLAVNIGGGHAIKCLQRAIRACGYTVAEDGIIGPMTADICQRIEMSVAPFLHGAEAGALGPVKPQGGTGLVSPLLAALRSEAAGYYRTVDALSRGERRDADRGFLKGWLARAYA